jgi:hypothetical protein
MVGEPRICSYLSLGDHIYRCSYMVSEVYIISYMVGMPHICSYMSLVTIYELIDETRGSYLCSYMVGGPHFPNFAILVPRLIPFFSQTWALNARAAAHSRGRLEESLIGDRNSSLTWAWARWSKVVKERVHSRHVADEWLSAWSSKCMSGCFAVWKLSIGDARRERRCASVADAAARRRTRHILSASIGAWHTLRDTLPHIPNLVHRFMIQRFHTKCVVALPPGRSFPPENVRRGASPSTHVPPSLGPCNQHESEANFPEMRRMRRMRHMMTKCFVWKLVASREAQDSSERHLLRGPARVGFSTGSQVELTAECRFRCTCMCRGQVGSIRGTVEEGCGRVGRVRLVACEALGRACSPVSCPKALRKCTRPGRSRRGRQQSETHGEMREFQVWGLEAG